MSALSTTVTAPRTAPGPVRRSTADAWTLALRVLLFYKNSPGLVGVSLGAPLAMLVVFGYVFGSAIHVPGGEDYRGYLTPGLFVMISVNGVMASMIGAARGTLTVVLRALMPRSFRRCRCRPAARRSG